MTQPWLRAASFALAAVVLLSLAAARAQDAPDDLMRAAMQAHQAGGRCLAEGRKPGANQFLENEKAIGHLEQAQRLLERYLEARPDDRDGEALMQDVLSLLFWCHKMSPMVDPEEVEPEPPTPEAPPSTTEADPPPTASEPPPVAPAPEAEARRLLQQAREFAAAHPDDAMGALAKLFYVAEQFPATIAGQEAKAEAERLQAQLFAVAPVVQPRPQLQPLTKQDLQQVERVLRDWLDQRRRLRCASCKGQGATVCRACDGTGELQGRAGRRSTCTRCRRGKVPCERRGCVEGIDLRALERVVIAPRAPYYQEKLRSLLGGHRDAVDRFLEALAAVLAGSARAPAEISRAATELGIAPVQLRDVIEAHGPSPKVAREFTNYSLGDVGRKARYTLRGDEQYEETVSFEQQDGKWYLRRIGDE